MAWTARLGTLITAIVIFRMAFEIWWIGRLHEHFWVQTGLAVMYLYGGAFLVAALLDIDHRKLHVAGFIALVFTLGFYTFVTINVATRHYSSDALLFVHQSALLLQQGVNPYSADLVSAYAAFEVPYYVQTPVTSGGIVTHLNYPALSFLVFLPFTMIGLDDLRPVCAAFLVAIMGIIWISSPRHLRLLACGVLFLSSFFISFALSTFDIVFIFFLVAAVVLWRTRLRESMIAFGMAAAVKQTVWFIAPFLLIRLWKEASDLPTQERAVHVAKHAAWATAPFLVFNLPFILVDPQAWFVGVFTPLGASGETLVPLVQGVFIFLYTGAATVPPILTTLFFVATTATGLALYWRYFERLREMVWVVPVPILLFHARALQNYYEMFYPVALVVLLLSMPKVWREAT